MYICVYTFIRRCLETETYLHTHTHTHRPAVAERARLSMRPRLSQRPRIRPSSTRDRLVGGGWQTCSKYVVVYK